MQNNIVKSQSKPEPKWQGMSSFILGVITAIPVLCSLIAFSISYTTSHAGPTLSMIYTCTMIVGWIWFQLAGWIFPAAGFVLGIMGLKYTKKRLAVTGIILSIVGFVAYTFIYYLNNWD